MNKNRRSSLRFLAASMSLGFTWFNEAIAVVQTTLQVTPEIISSLKSFREEPKFEDVGIYQAPTAAIRAESASHLNDLLDRLIATVPHDPTKSHVLSEFRRTLSFFDRADTEERDRICEYLERTMDILGIDSSDGLLNKWRYGFDPAASH